MSCKVDVDVALAVVVEILGDDLDSGGDGVVGPTTAKFFDVSREYALCEAAVDSSKALEPAAAVNEGIVKIGHPFGKVLRTGTLESQYDPIGSLVPEDGRVGGRR